jgi:hypothetical protein
MKRSFDSLGGHEFIKRYFDSLGDQSFIKRGKSLILIEVE